LRGAIIWRMNDCTFCEIVAGRLPSFRVLEDEHTLAFLDIRPVSPRWHGDDLPAMLSSAPVSRNQLDEVLDLITSAW
jgi:diadenosine tetraphosphate (Ap4A) HIT family hydrolase